MLRNIEVLFSNVEQTDYIFLAMLLLIALHFTPVSEWVIDSASRLVSLLVKFVSTNDISAVQM